MVHIRYIQHKMRLDRFIVDFIDLLFIIVCRCVGDRKTIKDKRSL